MATFIDTLTALAPDVLWALDDASGATSATIADTSGNARHGTVVGTLTPSTWFIPNLNTSAMRSTNAVNGRVSLNDAAWMTATNTTGFWALISYKPNSESFSSQRDIFGKMDMWQLWQETTGRLTAYITPAWTGLLTIGAAGILAIDTPYFIVLRKTPTHWSIWINGVKNTEVAHTNSPADSSGPLMAGASANPQRNYRGDIQVMAYKVGHSNMTDAKIAELYAAWAAAPPPPPPPAQGPEAYELDLYQDDGTTIAVTFSTDPDEPMPYLMAPENLALQEVDFAEGRATIGGLTVEVVDVPTDPADQDSGAVTAILADADGIPATLGRRAHLKFYDGTEFKNVINGIVGDITLHESYSSFTLTLKDTRELERKMSAFTRAITSAIFPRGSITGFGYNEATDTWIVPPIEPATAVYREDTIGGVNYGFLDFPFRADRVPLWQIVPPSSEEMLRSFTGGGSVNTYNPSGLKYDRVRLLWRDVGETEYNIVDPPGYITAIPGIPLPSYFNKLSWFGDGTYELESGEVVNVRYFNAWGWVWEDGETNRPTPDSEIEIILGYVGPASADFPLHIEGTFGEVLKDIYDGVYSDAPPGILYDEDAVLALTEPFRGRITEPLETEGDVWAWTEENIYAPLGAAPALDADGLVSPVRAALPDGSTELLQLTDDNCEPAPAWSHTSDDVINTVRVKYTRLYPVPFEQDPTAEKSASDGLVEREITAINDRDPVTAPTTAASIAIFGERAIEISSVGLTALGDKNGEPLSGDVADETGAQIAAQRTYEVLNRFLNGGQHYTLNVMRSALGAGRVGDWCVVACSWLPEYATGRRGASRLAQIVSLQPLDTAWAELHLVDAGAFTLPLAPPEPETPTENDDGSITVPVTIPGPSSLYQDLINLDPTVLHFFGESSGSVAEDSSSKGHDGQYQGAVTLAQPSIIPNVTATSARFVGSTAYVKHSPHAEWMETGDPADLWIPDDGNDTSGRYPNKFCALWFIRPNNTGSVSLANIAERWFATLTGGATDQVSADMGSLSDTMFASLPSGYENELLMIVVQKSSTLWESGHVNSPPTIPSEPGYQHRGIQYIYINGALAFTGDAVSPSGYATAGDFEIMRPISSGDDFNAQVFAFWNNAEFSSNLSEATIEALWEKANADPLTVVAAECVEMQYALSDTEPPVDSPLWRFGGQRCSDGDIIIPPVPTGVNVWIRTRSTRAGYPPSPWSTAVMVPANTTPGFRRATAWLDPGAVFATVEWEGNGYTNGVRVYYDVHVSGTTPTFSTYFDIDSPPPGAVQTIGIPEAMPTDTFPPYVTSIQLEPYPTFSAGAVSGTPGPIRSLSVTATGLAQAAIAYTDSDGTTESRILLDEDFDVPFTRRDNTLGAIPLSSANELAVTRSDGSTIDLIPAVP